jgi:hypothetical protein
LAEPQSVHGRGHAIRAPTRRGGSAPALRRFWRSRPPSPPLCLPQARSTGSSPLPTEPVLQNPAPVQAAEARRGAPGTYLSRVVTGALKRPPTFRGLLGAPIGVTAFQIAPRPWHLPWRLCNPPLLGLCTSSAHRRSPIRIWPARPCDHRQPGPRQDCRHPSRPRY